MAIVTTAPKSGDPDGDRTRTLPLEQPPDFKSGDVTVPPTGSLRIGGPDGTRTRNRLWGGHPLHRRGRISGCRYRAVIHHASACLSVPFTRDTPLGRRPG